MTDESRRDDIHDRPQVEHLEPGVRDSGAGVGEYGPGGRAKTPVHLVIGAVLMVIGLVGIALYAFMPRSTPVEGDAQADSVLQATIIIGAAVFFGVGLLLLVRGIVLRRRGHRT
jgi:hypothetical protein